MLTPMPETLDQIRAVLDRERRHGERRADEPDTRAFPTERRKGDRRDSEREVWMSIDDEMIVEQAVLEPEAPVVPAGKARSLDFDLTGIRDIGWAK